jgi:hypothetical protein
MQNCLFGVLSQDFINRMKRRYSEQDDILQLTVPFKRQKVQTLTKRRREDDVHVETHAAKRRKICEIENDKSEPTLVSKEEVFYTLSDWCFDDDWMIETPASFYDAMWDKPRCIF